MVDKIDDDMPEKTDTGKPMFKLAQTPDKATGIAFVSIFFEDYLPPNGFLDRDPACHALFYYNLIARKAYEETEKDVIVLEGEDDPQNNYKQQFTSVATMYGVSPERMIKFWSHVVLTCNLHKIPVVPDRDKYRFNRSPKIKSN